MLNGMLKGCGTQRVDSTGPLSSACKQTEYTGMKEGCTSCDHEYATVPAGQNTSDQFEGSADAETP